MALRKNREDRKHSTEVWKSLSERCLPPRNPDSDFWWQLTGYHMANLVEAAGYTIDKQYEILLIHYHWIVPRLGPAPGPDGRAKWKSLVGIEGSPIEYSWKWNTSKGEPDVRYSWEAINQRSGTPLDPLNHGATLDFMHEIPAVVPDADFSWVHHFLAHLFDHDIAKYVREGDEKGLPPTTVIHGIEYVRSGVGLKSYFIPRRVGQVGPMPIEQWDEAIVKLDSNNATRDTMMKFIRENSEGQLFKPVIMGIDDVEPSSSRLKLYFTTPHTSFKSVREIMTLGGLIDVPEEKMQDLRSFISATLCLPDDYPEDKEIPHEITDKEMWAEAEALIDGYVYYFDIAPGSSKAIPDIKFHNPTRRYGPDDLSIARGLTSWLKARGRGQYCDSYMRMVESVCEHRDLAKGKGLHTYLTYMFNKKGGEPDIKSYLIPEAYHPNRRPLAKQNGTRDS
ncbi:dimethylallyl tryptophan synthase GliD1 [Xylaria arbuscula]|nr:dimethylallyl tryptophan synthase GliD1 [Xylaria arbuscula]